jgi:hypothetical protein
MGGKSALSIVRKYHPKVTRILDSREDVTVIVTADDCAKSKSKAADECAMATACMRKHDGAIISLARAYLIDGKTAHRFSVPDGLTREIISFDRNHDFRPGAYTLKKIPKADRLGPRRYPVDKNRHKKKYANNHKRYHKTEGIRAL